LKCGSVTFSAVAFYRRAQHGHGRPGSGFATRICDFDPIRLKAGGSSSSAWADCGSVAVQYQRKRPDIRLAFYAFITMPVHPWSWGVKT